MLPDGPSADHLQTGRNRQKQAECGLQTLQAGLKTEAQEPVLTLSFRDPVLENHVYDDIPPVQLDFGNNMYSVNFQPFAPPGPRPYKLT
jgi:hypothetical protein